MLSDDELAKIRERKMKLLMEKAKKAEEPQPVEPLSKGFVNQLNDANFWSVMQKTKIALIDFYGEWCAPCRQLAPIFSELAQDYKGEVFFGKIDVDKSPRVATQFQVQSVPMVIAFVGGKPVGKLPGLRPYAAYDDVIQRILDEKAKMSSAQS